MLSQLWHFFLLLFFPHLLTENVELLENRSSWHKTNNKMDSAPKMNMHYLNRKLIQELQAITGRITSNWTPRQISITLYASKTQIWGI